LPRYNLGQKQLQKYIDKALNSGIMGWERGSDARLFPDGRTDVSIGYIEHDGSWYEINIFADSGKWIKDCKVQGLQQGSTGLVFYYPVKMGDSFGQKLLRGLADNPPEFIILPGPGGIPIPR
jgi:hypothetical protein